MLTALLFAGTLPSVAEGRVAVDSLTSATGRSSAAVRRGAVDSLAVRSTATDSLAMPFGRDSLSMRRRADTAATQPKKPFLEEIISGKNKDSLYYDVRNKQVHIYEQGDVNYGNSMNIKSDYMRLSVDKKEILAYGKADTSALGHTRPQFTDAGSTYTMDTVTYNISTKRAKIKGVVTQDGEGYLTGQDVKMMDDKSFNISGGHYTTCDKTDHPHFYINMTKAKVIPNEKIVAGPSWLVVEDVPLFPIVIPELFFPMNMERETGLIMPSYGEDATRGFFLRDGGYYFSFNDYLDLKLLAGIYTLGSWEASAASTYTVRYKFRGSVSANYANTIIGDKGSSDYKNTNNFKLTWQHSQDAKFRPNSTFSASVNYTTSGYNKQAATTLNDYLSSQTNSSIAYSKSWAGTPISMSANMQLSQNTNTGAVALTAPSMVINVSRIYPFKRKVMVGKERWYEKIAMTYKAQMSNQTVNAADSTLFTSKTLREMKNGVQHSIPISASFNVLGAINITPSINYTERWYFRKINQSWNAKTESLQRDTLRGFYRVYNYSAAVSASTTLYGLYRFINQDGYFKAIRHTLNPSVSFSIAPNFSDPKYGYYNTVQASADGSKQLTYSPFAGEMYGVPGSGRNASMSFSLSQTLEAKVRSQADTSGMKKVKIIDELAFSGSYNFLADSMKLSTISLRFRTSLIPNFGINLSAILDPYEVDKQAGVRVNKLMWRRGLPGRIASTGWSCGYTFKSSDLYTEATINDISKMYPEYSNPFFFDPNDPLAPSVRRQLMTAQYYDFSLPWNFSFNYSINYTNNGFTKRITNTLNFNGSLTLTKKLGVTFTGGYDFEGKALTPGTVSISRDLHCWQMNFVCVPFGAYKSWSFNISVKSSLLSDLKYEKSSSRYDNLYE
ncbi:MAG: putative LPS assembly protein LptD [Tidjanibacter sp.]|nr:putative LPS assembly protein LptD [Tidjanibacter sp.]